MRFLVREHFGATGDATPYPGGATLAAGTTGWLLAEERPERSLGPALAWARQHGVDDLHVLADRATGVLARRAALFAAPPAVWRVDGRDLRPAEADPPPVVEPVPAEALALGARLAAAGADVVHEHGIVVGEVLGLEVARVVDGRIEVGVGRHDREAFQLVHGDLPQEQALAQVITTVRRHRRPDAPDHPLKRLAPERWLRRVVMDRPALVGAEQLAYAEGALPRPSVKEPWPAPLASEGVFAVCSVGVDLDLVPTAADDRAAAWGGEKTGRLVLVVPERDDHPVTRALAAALREPADVVTVPGDWRE